MWWSMTLDGQKGVWMGFECMLEKTLALCTLSWLGCYWTQGSCLQNNRKYVLFETKLQVHLIQGSRLNIVITEHIKKCTDRNINEVMASKCKCTCDACKVGRWKKKSKKMQRTVNSTGRKILKRSHHWRQEMKWDDSSSRASPSGKCCLLPQGVAGVTLRALLEILWIQMNVTERKGGFWYLYWKTSEIQKKS